ncbi:MAG: xylulokinase, partial [Caldilineaceae bacterium]|nr:xylulokinase [Caldilineaceae bacterium]
MSYFIGIDTSTTATKALLMGADGAVLGVAASEYGYEMPQPLWSEQAPALWWEATCASLQQLLAESGIDPGEIRALGLTGQMHGLVLLDEKRAVLRPAILWNDQRTAAECDEMRAKVGHSRLIQISGNDALTGFTAPKILWVRNHEPQIYERIRHVLLPKDYLRYRLTGELAMDKAGGAGTQLFDLRARDWSAELLADLGLPADWFPP